MNQRERNELDRHITGNYGEDQFELSDEEMNKRLDAYPKLVQALKQSTAILSDSCLTPKYDDVRQKRKDALYDTRALLRELGELS